MIDYTDALIGAETEDELQVLPELTEVETKAWDRIRKRIEAREIGMSFSAIKQFSESPFHYVRYKVASELKQDKGTAAMVFGSLVDCLCFTPDEVDNQFAKEPVGGAMNSNKGCDVLLRFYGEMFQGELDGLPEKNRADELSEMIDAISQALGPAKFEDKKQTIRAAKGICKKRIITDLVLHLAKGIKNRVYSNEASRRIMYQLTATQVENEFEAFGWKWKGKFDGEGERLIADMKMMVSARPEKAMRTIRDMHYDWQGALYTLPRGGGKKFYNICLDRQLGVSVIHLDQRVLANAWGMVEEMVQHFERAIFEGMDDPSVWYSSYDFFAPRNEIYEYGR